MTAAPPDPSRQSLYPAVDELIRQARAALLDAEPFSVETKRVLAILSDPVARARLLRALQSNEGELERLVTEFLNGVALRQAHAAELTQLNVELIDRAALPVAAPVTIAGIALLFTAGLASGPIAFFVAGLAGLAAAGVGRYRIARSSLARRHEAELIQVFVAEVGRAGQPRTIR